jgi:fumarylacetoacetase
MRHPDATHDPALRSWVPGADGHPDFPIQNLPFGRFRPPAGDDDAPEDPVPAVAIADQVVDLVAAADGGLLPGPAADAVDVWMAEGMGAFLQLGPEAWGALRQGVSELLRADTEEGGEAREMGDELVRPMAGVELLLPTDIGDYTDFYASVHHATNVGSMFRPDNPLLPNYKWVPIGYHGRASSIVPSGTPIHRPMGQLQQGEAPPEFGFTRQLDYELELGAVVGVGNPLGRPIPIEQADDHLFGLVLLNDWSARDIQRWEYQPLGPFLAKNFASTISPWIVTLEALAPFRAPAFRRPSGDPEPLPYLDDADDQRQGGFDITLEVLVSTRTMREQGFQPMRVSRGSFGGMYWTVAQLLAHHASNGCNLRPGDLLGSGTISGPEPETRGCLLERTWRGTEPLRLPSGETRKFLEDGDEVVFRAWCERPGYARIGFGECRGQVGSGVA